MAGPKPWRNALANEQVADDLYDIVLGMNAEEATRRSAIDAKASNLFGTIGLTVGAVFGFGGIIIAEHLAALCLVAVGAGVAAASTSSRTR